MLGECLRGATPRWIQSTFPSQLELVFPVFSSSEGQFCCSLRIWMNWRQSQSSRDGRRRRIDWLWIQRRRGRQRNRSRTKGGKSREINRLGRMRQRYRTPRRPLLRLNVPCSCSHDVLHMMCTHTTAVSSRGMPSSDRPEVPRIPQRC
jgi:hypothetical protein